MQSNSNKKIFIIIGAVLIGVVCLCCVAAVLVWVLILKPSRTSTSQVPPYYGVFLKEENNFKDLVTLELVDYPTASDIGSAPQASSSSPVLAVYLQNADLMSYAVLYSVNDQNTVDYNVAPTGQGYLEVTPVGKLYDGLYCLIQGDPLASFIPAWCFQVGE